MINEEQTRYNYIDPKLKQSGWGSNDSRVLTKHKITDGRI
jgi:type I site-specific restriction endonuclease